MSKQGPTDIAVSVRQRLLNYSKQKEQDFQTVLAQFAFERLLHRLELSPYSSDFVLKGALLFLVWTDEPYRPTRDMDLASKNTMTENALLAIFRNLCSTETENDGLVFSSDDVVVTPIRDDSDYGGMRVTLTARLARARIPLQVDIGFADAITPAARLRKFPSLLDFPRPSVAIYPPETSVAEKLHTIVVRGILNSRMKDYYDIWSLSRMMEFEGNILAEAIAATFRRRDTSVPSSVPIGLSKEFATDNSKQKQWLAFINRTPLTVVEHDLGRVVDHLHGFLMPPLAACSSGAVLGRRWPKGGPWMD